MTRSLVRCCVLAVSVSCGGGGGDDPDARPGGDGGGGESAVARYEPFEPGAGGPWGVIPYPSDLYLDDQGLLTLTSLPSGPGANPDSEQYLTEALHTLDGAGVWSGFYVEIEGDSIDPATLEGNVHLVDMDDGMAEVPIDVIWRDDLDVIAAMPKLGVGLRQNRTYAAYVTDGVETTGGASLAADEGFTRVADLSTTPSDPAEAAAQASVMPLLSALDAAEASSVVVATVFETASVTAELRAMRDVVDQNTPTITVDEIVGPDGGDLDAVFGDQADDAPPGYDGPVNAPRAQPNGQVSVMVHGTIGLPSFLSDTANVDGFPTYDGSGVPEIKGTHAATFTLVLPDIGSWADVPVVLYTHGVNRTRLDALTQADTVTRKGWALLVIDQPYHGDRANGAVDTQNELLGTNTPDGFGDTQGLLPAVGLFHLGESGGIPQAHPRGMRENLRQAAVDVISLVELVADGDLGPIQTALNGVGGLPDDLSFRGDVALLSESLGCMLSIPALAVEPRLKVASLSSCAGGFPYPAMLHSPAFSGTFVNAVVNPYDLTRLDLTDPIAGARFDPIVMLFNSVLERGEASGYAPYVTNGSVRGDDGASVSVTMSWGDDVVPNDSSEHLAGMMGLPRLLTSASTSPPGDPLRSVELPEVSGPVSGNAGGGQTSAALTVLYPASHATVRQINGQLAYEPDYPPFVQKDPVQLIEPNPLVEIHAMYTTLFEDYFTGANDPPRIIDPF